MSNINIIPKGIIFLLAFINSLNFKEQRDKAINISKNQPAETKFSIFSIKLNVTIVIN